MKTVLSRGSALVGSVCLRFPARSSPSGLSAAACSGHLGDSSGWLSSWPGAPNRLSPNALTPPATCSRSSSPAGAWGASYSGWLQALGAHWNKPMRRPRQTLAEADPGLRRTPPDARWLAGLRCRRLASRSARAHGHRQGRGWAIRARQEADGSAVVSDVAVAHGHGLVVGITASGPARPTRNTCVTRKTWCRTCRRSPWSWPTPVSLPAVHPLCRRLQDAHRSLP